VHNCRVAFYEKRVGERDVLKRACEFLLLPPQDDQTKAGYRDVHPVGIGERELQVLQRRRFMRRLKSRSPKDIQDWHTEQPLKDSFVTWQACKQDQPGAGSAASSRTIHKAIFEGFATDVKEKQKDQRLSMAGGMGCVVTRR
jgi:hypothetical protein